MGRNARLLSKSFGVWAVAACALAFAGTHAGLPTPWIVAAVAASALVVAIAAETRSRGADEGHTLRFSRAFIALATVLMGLLFIFDED